MPLSDQHKAFHPSAMVDEPVPTTPRRRGHRRRKGPKPWFVLKLSVAVAAAIIAYTGYVYIGRLCIPMIKRERNSLGSRRLGGESRRLPRTSLCLSLFVIFWSCGGGFILTGLLIFYPRVSHFLGCFCRAWDDDDLGIYQGACSVLSCPTASLAFPPSCPPLPRCSACMLMREFMFGFGWDLGSGFIYPTRLCQGEPLPCCLPCPVLARYSSLSYMLRIMMSHHHRHHHPSPSLAACMCPVCALLSDGLVSPFPAADMIGCTRVFGTSRSFLHAHLAVLFMIVAVFSICRHDFPGPLRHITVSLDLMGVWLIPRLGCQHASYDRGLAPFVLVP